MIHFFVDPYDDENITSIFARYHYYSGNYSNNDTIEELFGVRNIVTFKTFPSRLAHLELQLRNTNYTADYFIYKHTIFPLYSVFLSRKKYDKAIKYMKDIGSNKIHLMLGMAECKLNKKDWYMYCPICVEEEFNRYGEAYFHRMHQVQGILVCEKHGCKLEDYIEEYKSETEFTILNYNKIPKDRLGKGVFYDKFINDVLFEISKAANFVMKIEPLKYCKEDIIKMLHKMLEQKGYLTLSGRVRQDKLIVDLYNYYGDKVLELLGNRFPKDNGNWIRLKFSKLKQGLNPVETILIILFLTDNDISKFFEDYNSEGEMYPFGKGPWPCLNPVCNYYKKNVIKNIEIKKSYKSKLPCGIFKCSICGYAYRRKGPDKTESDNYRKDKVLEFGEVWEREFKKAIKRGDKKKHIVVKFQVYYRFIEYYKKNNKFTSRNYKHNLGKIQDNFNKYTNEIKNYMKLNHGCTKSQVKKEMSRQVGWLEYHHLEWLNKNLPKAKKNEIGNCKKYNYKELDEETYKEISIIYNRIISTNERKRITITLLRRLTKYKIQYKLDRLPRTKALISNIIETGDQYCIRKVKQYCDQLLLENIYVSRGNIIQITSSHRYYISKECKSEIDNIIDDYFIKYISGKI